MPNDENIDIYDYIECVHIALEELGYKQVTMEELKTNNLVFKTICDLMDDVDNIKKPNLSEVTKNFYTLKEGEQNDK